MALEDKIAELDKKFASGAIDSDEFDRSCKIAEIRDMILLRKIAKDDGEARIKLILAKAGFKDVRKFTPAPSSPTVVIQTHKAKRVAADIATAQSRAQVPVIAVNCTTFVDPTSTRKDKVVKEKTEKKTEKKTDSKVTPIKSLPKAPTAATVLPEYLIVVRDNIRARIKSGEITVDQGRKEYITARDEECITDDSYLKRIIAEKSVGDCVETRVIEDSIPAMAILLNGDVKRIQLECGVKENGELNGSEAIKKIRNILLSTGQAFSKIVIQTGVIMQLITKINCNHCNNEKDNNRTPGKVYSGSVPQPCPFCNGAAMLTVVTRKYCEDSESAHKALLSALANGSAESGSKVTNIINRTDLLEEEKVLVRNIQPVIPSRKSGAFQAKKPTNSGPMMRGAHNYVATFSHG